MSDSVRPHRWKPTRLPRPWDSPGKNTGVGCHFLLQGMKVKRESEVAQPCPTLSDPMDCSLPGSSIHVIFQARVLEWGAIAFSETCVSILYWCFSFWLTSLSVMLSIFIHIVAYVGEGNGIPLQYSCLENHMDGGAWWPTAHEVAKSQHN